VLIELLEQADLLALVDAFHRLEDLERVVLRGREAHHGLDVLREAAPAIPDARKEE
jgi:hypothetical protein